MRKSQSILKLEELGLNTLDYFITSDKQEAMHYLSKHLADKVSMRTERGDEFKCPFYYMIPGETMMQYATKHLEEGYKLIFSPSLDVKGCVMFGTIALGQSASDCIEVVIGEGKVRELDNHPNKQTFMVNTAALRAVSVNDNLHPEHVAIINDLFRKVRHISYEDPEIVPCVFEFSYYSEGVGRLNDKDIWWEVRPYA